MKTLLDLMHGSVLCKTMRVRDYCGNEAYRDPKSGMWYWEQGGKVECSSPTLGPNWELVEPTQADLSVAAAKRAQDDFEWRNRTRSTSAERYAKQHAAQAQAAPEVERWELVQDDILRVIDTEGTRYPIRWVPFLEHYTFLGIEAKLPDGEPWPIPGAFWLWWSEQLQQWSHVDYGVALRAQGTDDWRAITPPAGGPAVARMQRKGGSDE